MDVTKTRIELVNDALGKLMVVASGQSAEAEDEALVDGKVDALILQLATDEICDITDADAIPSEWFDPVSSLLANVCASYFGRPYSLDAKTTFERQLIRLTSPRPTYEVLKADYF